MLQRRRHRHAAIPMPPLLALPAIRRRLVLVVLRVMVLAHALRRVPGALGTHASEAAVRWRTSRGRSGVLGARAAAAVRAPAAAEDAENEGAAETGGKADDEGQVLVDPGFDFVTDIAIAAALW